jgi:hypothetical protein
LLVVHDLVQLHRQQAIDFGNARIQHRLGIRTDDNCALRISETNFVIRSLPRSPLPSLPNRPCWTIWSSRLDWAASAAAPAGTWASAFDIGRSLLFDFRPQLPEAIGVIDRSLQDLIELVVALQAAAQIRQLLAQLEQFAQRLDLLGDALRKKSSRLSNLTSTPILPASALSLFSTLKVRRGCIFFSVVEVVGRDFHEFAVAQAR